MADDDTGLRVGMSVEGGGGFFLGSRTPRKNAPVHEQLTVAALIQSDFKLDPSLTFITLRDNPTKYPDFNDFVRGVIWNDDPECLLFEENPSVNLEYSTAFSWGIKYGRGMIPGVIDKSELIQRSHFGDLQWLHAMASYVGEDFNETKSKVLRWMEMTYKLATGVVDPSESLQKDWMKDTFSNPSVYKTIGQLFTHGYQDPANFQHRALGSCFHIIQDSYAIGHTRREPLNEGDRIPGDGIKYRPGVADRWGPIMNFHTYVGQGSEHGHFDHSLDGSVEDFDLRNPDSWNNTVGCRDGLDACIKLANYWNRKSSWDEVFVWLDTVVFKLSSKITPGDNTVT